MKKKSIDTVIIENQKNKMKNEEYLVHTVLDPPEDKNPVITHQIIVHLPMIIDTKLISAH